MSEKLRFRDFDELMKVENHRSYVLGEYVDKVLFLKNDAQYIDNMFVGSTLMKRDYADSFYSPLSDKTLDEAKALLNASDYDIALKLDSFVLETLSRLLPTMRLKEQSKDGVYGTKRFLQTVYTVPVRDFVELDLAIFAEMAAELYTPSSVKRGVVFDEEFLNRNIEFLFVNNLDKIRALWSRIPGHLFAESFWKKSPTFIGADNLRSTFEMLEALVDWTPKKFGALKTSGQGVGGGDAAVPVAPDPIAWFNEAPAQIQWGVQPAPDDLVWVDEAVGQLAHMHQPNMAAGAAA